MSGRNNSNNRQARNNNTNRNRNNNSNRNSQNGNNQVRSLPGLARTVTGFHYVSPYLQLSENGNNTANNNLLPAGLPILPMRTMTMMPTYGSSTRPANIPAFLEAEGVPLDTPTRPGDTGRGPLPHMSLYIAGATPAQMEEAYRRERASMLYQMLSDRGYFMTPRAHRRPVREVLGVNGPQTPSVLPSITVPPTLSVLRGIPLPPRGVPSLSSTRAPAGMFSYMPAAIPVREGAELRMVKNTLGSNAVDLEDFVDGETVEVLYTQDQVQRLNRGERVKVTPSMVLKSTSVEGLIKAGTRQNPTTRQPIAMRERRVLKFVNSNNNSQGGKRKTRKSTRKNRKH